MRLIDADRLKIVINTNFAYPESINERIDAQPTMGKTLVEHGHWIPEIRRINRRIYKCSICGNFLDMSGVNAGRSDARYCPCCGAKMDKKTAEEGDGE